MRGNYLTSGQRLSQRQRGSAARIVGCRAGFFFSPAEGAQWEQRQVFAHITGSKLPIVSKEMTQQEERVGRRLLLPASTGARRQLPASRGRAACGYPNSGEGYVGISPQQPQHSTPSVGKQHFLIPTSSQPAGLWAGAITQIPTSLGCFPSPGPLCPPQWEKGTWNLLGWHWRCSVRWWLGVGGQREGSPRCRLTSQQVPTDALVDPPRKAAASSAAQQRTAAEGTCADPTGR